MENEQLVARINAGVDTAENMLALYKRMKGLIYTIAKRYAGLAELDDLAQEGYIALCEAVSHYDPAAGVKFSSYAGICMKRHMLRYIHGNCALDIPERMQALVYQYEQLCSLFQAEYGREPINREIAYYLGLDGKQTAHLKKTAEMSRTVSLDSPLSDEEGELTLCDTIQSRDNVERDILDQVQQEQLKRSLWEAVDSLSGEQPEIIRRRYQDNMTLQAIGDSLGMTREKVRQMECKGMRALRTTHRKKLLPFLDEYISTRAYSGNGIGAFNRTWTSSTERVALELAEP